MRAGGRAWESSDGGGVSDIPLDVLFQTGNVKSGVDAGHFGGRGVDDDDLAAAREDRGS